MKKAHNVTRICAAFDIARSTLYDWEKRQHAPLPAEKQRLLAEVRIIHQQTNASYGRRRMSLELRRRSFDIGPYQARTLMRQAGVSAQVPKPPSYPKTQGALDKVAPNYLDRQFDTDCPGTVFASDITYIWTQAGWLYLAVVMDLYARRIVGWACSDTPDTDLVTRALRLALPQRHASGFLMFHSDQGCQYTSTAFRAFLDEHDVVQSMSRRGNCWDNAPVERFFRSLKTERIRNTIYANHQEARRDANDYIANFYNTMRLHSAARGKPPAEHYTAWRKIA